LTTNEAQAPTQPISALVNHVSTRDVHHFQPNPQQQFQVLEATKKSLKFGALGAAARDDVVRDQIVRKIEQSRTEEATTSPELAFKGEHQRAEFPPVGGE
jgi:hypothetical protein